MLRGEHLRFRREAPGSRQLYCLVLDCSASMLRRRNLSLAKGLLQQWTAQLYRQRAQLLVIGFSGRGARVLFGPGRAQPFNDAWIAPIGGGGSTPVAAALALAERLLARAQRRQGGLRSQLWLLSDGRFSELPARPAADFCGLVDFDDPRLPLGRAARLAAHWQAPCVPAASLVKNR